jgi:hypothetical protein
MSQNALKSLIDEIGLKPTKRNLTRLGIMLQQIVQRDQPYGYKYLHAILNEYYEPSPMFTRAVEAMLSSTDDGSAELAAAQQVTVFSSDGNIEGAIIYGKTQRCRQCFKKFVGHPLRLDCMECSPPRSR